MILPLPAAILVLSIGSSTVIWDKLTLKQLTTHTTLPSNQWGEKQSKTAHPSVRKLNLGGMCELHSEQLEHLQKFLQWWGINTDVFGTVCHLLYLAKGDKKNYTNTNTYADIMPVLGCSENVLQIHSEGKRKDEGKANKQKALWFCAQDTCAVIVFVKKMKSLQSVKPLFPIPICTFQCASMKCSCLWISSSSRWDWFINSLKG